MAITLTKKRSSQILCLVEEPKRSVIYSSLGDKMFDISSINAISGILAAIGVIIGVVLTILELRNITKTRQMDMLMGLYLTWGSEDMKKAFEKVVTMEFKDYNDAVKKYGSITSADRSAVWVAVDRVSFFMNGLGYLVYEKFAAIRQVDDLFGHGVTFLWDKMKPLVEGWRKQLKLPRSSQWFEYLYDEVRKREQRLQIATVQ